MESLERRMTFPEQITTLTRGLPAFQEAWELIKTQQSLALILIEVQACLIAETLEKCLLPSTQRIEALDELKHCLMATALAVEEDKTAHVEEPSP